MRYFAVCAFLAVLWVVSAWSGTALASGSAEFMVGKAAVWAIADSVGGRDMGVFPGADPETVAKYVPSGKAPSATMTFLVKLGGEVILIDAGNGSGASQLGEGLKQIGVKPEEITLVLISHMHGDHIGGLVKDGAKAFPSARILSSKAEHDFFLDPKADELYPARRGGFEMARNIFGLYASASETFEFGDEIVPGIKALDARGHTPGHTAFMLESEGARFLFWGDIAHAAALQFPRPDINASYDMLPDEAAAARARYMEMAAAEKLPIAGVHLPFPGVGAAEKNPEGGYIYISR